MDTTVSRAPFQGRANIAKAGHKPFALNINDLWKKAIDDEQFASYFGRCAGINVENPAPTTPLCRETGFSLINTDNPISGS
jgi:hypothetical protein